MRILRTRKYFVSLAVCVAAPFLFTGVIMIAFAEGSAAIIAGAVVLIGVGGWVGVRLARTHVVMHEQGISRVGLFRSLTWNWADIEAIELVPDPRAGLYAFLMIRAVWGRPYQLGLAGANFGSGLRRLQAMTHELQTQVGTHWAHH